MLFDFATLSPLETYKLLAATVVPRPIAWVITRSASGVLNAAPYSFFNVLSGDPPIVALGIGARAPSTLKDTGENIAATKQFVVNLVTMAQADAMNVTAIEFPPDVDELREAGLSTLPSTKVSPPRIAGSPVALECELFQTLDLGPERAIVLGRVVAMHIDDAAVIDRARCYVDTPALDLVGRMGGASGYASTRDGFEVKRIRPEDWTARAAE